MKRRDFLKGVVCSACYGSLIGCNLNKPPLTPACESGGDYPALEIIVKKTFSADAGPLQISMQNENGELLFMSQLISPLEMTKGKILKFSLQQLPSKGSMRVIYGYYGRVPSEGLLETNIINS